MTTVVYTAPATEPLTLSEAKLHLRVDVTDDDTLITSMIKVARQQAEQELRRALITQTIDVYFDAFGTRLLLPPVSAVSAITYVDTAGATQTLAADQYLVDVISEPAKVCPAYAVTWPATRDQANAVKVRCTAGYGNAAAVPEAIKQWMLMRISSMYDNRAEYAAAGRDVKVASLPFVDSLLDPYRVTGRI
jgi:uncharacterized phiE125 gp8 family phage protein